MKHLIEGEDFYYNERGLVVLTEDYLLRRGKCCGSWCTNCPYNYENVDEPRRSKLIKERRENDTKEKKQPDS